MNEADTCDQYVSTKLRAAGWGSQPHSIRQEYQFTAGKIVISDRGAQRGRGKIADFVLNYAQDFPIAVVEVKAISKNPEAGLQQAKSYAEMLGLQFAYATNGQKIIEFDLSNKQTRELEEFPAPEELWARLRSNYGLGEKKAVNYLLTPSVGAQAHPHRTVAINQTIQAILQEQKRILLVMASGTGKTFVACQVCWKLWNDPWNCSGENRRPKILYLTNRTSLTYSAYEAYRIFGDNRYILKERLFQGNASIYFTTYQFFCTENFYTQYPSNFFDLIIIDECERSISDGNSNWRQLLKYFGSAYQIGFTTVSVEYEESDFTSYFGSPIFTYSLKQGIEDGFLAPFRVHEIHLQPAENWSSEVSLNGGEDETSIEDLTPDFLRGINYLKLPQTVECIAQYITDFLRATDRFAKTIVFCIDQNHAVDIARTLTALNEDIVRKFPDYICSVGVADKNSNSHITNFVDLERLTPAIVTTSQMLLTGVDIPTCKNIVIARPIKSKTVLSQIISRGMHIQEDYGKLFFNILDFTQNIALIAESVGNTLTVDVVAEEDVVTEKVRVETASIISEKDFENQSNSDINDNELPRPGERDNEDETSEPEKKHIKNLIINNFKQLANTVLTFQDINILVGANNSGKSSILQAIHFITSICQSRNRVKNLSPFDEVDEDNSVISQEQLIYVPLSSLESLFTNINNSVSVTIEVTLSSEEQVLIGIKNNQNKSLSINLKGYSCFNTIGDIQNLFSIYVTGLAGISKSETYLSWGSLIRHIARGDSNLVLRNVLCHLHERPEKTGWVKFLESIKKVFKEIDDIAFPSLLRYSNHNG